MHFYVSFHLLSMNVSAFYERQLTTLWSQCLSLELFYRFLFDRLKATNRLKKVVCVRDHQHREALNNASLPLIVNS